MLAPAPSNTIPSNSQPEPYNSPTLNSPPAQSEPLHEDDPSAPKDIPNNAPPQNDDPIPGHNVPDVAPASEAGQGAALSGQQSPPSPSVPAISGCNPPSASEDVPLPIFDPRSVDAAPPTDPNADLGSAFVPSPATPANGAANAIVPGQPAPAAFTSVAADVVVVPGSANTPCNLGASGNSATPGSAELPGDAAPPPNIGDSPNDAIPLEDSPDRPADVGPNSIGLPRPISPSHVATPFDPNSPDTASLPENADGLAEDIKSPNGAASLNGALAFHEMATPHDANSPNARPSFNDISTPSNNDMVPVIAGGDGFKNARPIAASNEVVTPPFMIPSPASSHVARLQVNGHDAEGAENGALRIGGQTIAPGQETSIHGVAVSVGTEEVALDGTSYSIAPNPSSALHLLATFSPPVNGQPFTIPVGSGDSVDTARLSAALPGALLEVLSGGDSIVVHGLDAESLQGPLPSSDASATQPASSVSQKEGLDDKIVTAFTPEQTPTDKTTAQKLRAAVAGAYMPDRGIYF